VNYHHKISCTDTGSNHRDTLGVVGNLR